MVDFVVCLFEVVKGYWQLATMLLNLLHDASVIDELTDLPNTSSTGTSCPLSHISITAVCSLMYFATRPVKILYDVLRHVIGQLLFSLLRFFVFGSRTVLPDGHQ